MTRFVTALNIMQNRPNAPQIERNTGCEEKATNVVIRSRDNEKRDEENHLGHDDPCRLPCVEGPRGSTRSSIKRGSDSIFNHLGENIDYNT